MTTTYSSAQIDFNDGDTMLVLSSPYLRGSWRVTEDIYKAIDPSLIANKHGVIREDRINGPKGAKIFSFFIYDGVFSGITTDPSPISGGHDKWHYYINDINMYGGRVLISTIMPQAIESVDFTPPSRKELNIPEDFPMIGLSEDLFIIKGVVRFHIRDISSITTNDNATVYLVNDNQTISRKIFEAVNPVFIRSLRRITNPEELAECGYKDKTEIVKIELFDINDLTVEQVAISDDCPECRVTLLDNIQVDWKIFYRALHYSHIKEIREIEENDKKAFAPYRKLFPEKKLEFGKQITIVSL